MEELDLIDIADDLLIVNKITINRLFQLDNAAECIALYMLYYKTAKWQKTNQPKATDEYVKKCLKWGYDKIRKTKQTLQENGLIEIIQARKDGKINGWYVKVSYLMSNEKLKDIKIKTISLDNNNSNQELANPTSSDEKLNALKEKNKYLKIENESTLKDEKDIVEKSKNSKNDLILKENIKCIIDYLNEYIKSNYRYTTKGTIRLIKTKFKEGYTLDDFYDVIDKKVKEWKNTDMEKYLRPETLFGNKFENYLNQKIDNTFKGTPKSSYSSKSGYKDNTQPVRIYHITDEEFDKLSFEDKMKEMDKFDAVADMTKKQQEFYNEHCLARDEHGNLLKF